MKEIEADSEVLPKRAARAPKRTPQELARRFELVTEAMPEGYEAFCVLDGIRVDIDEVVNAPDDSLVGIRVGLPGGRQTIAEDYHLRRRDGEVNDEKVEFMRLLNAQARQSVALTGTCLSTLHSLVDAAGKLSKIAVKASKKAVKAERRASEAEASANDGIGKDIAEAAAIMGPKNFAALLKDLLGKKEAAPPRRKAGRRKVPCKK